MKAIILTYAPVSDFECELLINTKIFKLALNGHAKELCPDKRIITDYVLPKILNTCPEKIMSVREKLRCYSPQVEYPVIEFKGSTIVAAIDYLISKNYKQILIVGNNKVNSNEFQTDVNRQIDKLVKRANIYQYSNGNFNLKVKSIKEFI